MSGLQLLASCRAMLDALNKAVQHRQWQRASQIAMDYSQLLRQMDAAEQDPAVLAELIQLDIYHRRTMRVLSRKMEAVNDDIRSLESGQKSVRRTRDLAQSLFSAH